MSRLIVLRLIGGRLEGAWWNVPVRSMEVCVATEVPSYNVVEMVTTGCVEWREDGACAEIYVPEDKLDLWRAEHDVENL